jgi:putative hydrolase of the HAD superfamily
VKEDWPKAILLDLDDTIIAYSEGAEATWQDLCEEYAPHIGVVTPGDLAAVLSDVRRWYWKDPERHRRGRLNLKKARGEIVNLAFSQLGIVKSDDLAQEIADAFTTRRENAMEPFSGAVEALHNIRDKVKRLGLITNGNGEVQRAKIEKHNLTRFFDYVLVEGEYGLGKPHIEVYQHVLKHFDVLGDDAWMVGDNLEFDVAAPQSLGMKGIWLDHKGKGLPGDTPFHPDRIIRHLSELIQEGS